MASISLGLCPWSSLSHKFNSEVNFLSPPNVFQQLSIKRRRNCIVTKAASTSSTESLLRRTGNYHPNLWEDDFIQSLAKTYEDPFYAEQAERLIREVKDMFSAMPTAESREDLLQRLSMVDNVERLGIERHFQKEIKTALDYVYRYWNEQGIGCGRDSPCADLNTTALGFRILRLNRYKVSPDVLENFKGKDEQYLSSNCQTDQETKTIINLFRGSTVAFPGEKVLDEAKAFASTYLKEALKKTENSNLSQEIQFNLEYGWHTNVPRLEARNYIDIYGGEDSSWMACWSNKKILELAKLDFNIVQSIHQRELQILSRWWMESGLSRAAFARHRFVEFYFVAAGGCVEPKYSAFRLGLAKIGAILTVIDDIYDTYGTLDELKLFTDAIKRWDPSTRDFLPEYMKDVFMVLYETVNEMAQEAIKTQGRDTLDYARKSWEDYIDTFTKEAEWIAVGYIPTFKEYLENGKVSIGARMVNLQPLLTLDALLSESFLPEIDFPSRFDELIGLNLRISNDMKGFEAEAAKGEKTSCVKCYLRDNPSATKQQALNYLNDLKDVLLKELNQEYLKCDKVPPCSKDHAFNISRSLELFHKETNGFTISTKDIKDHIDKILIHPVTM